jgi:hypothetical protein
MDQNDVVRRPEFAMEQGRNPDVAATFTDNQLFRANVNVSKTVKMMSIPQLEKLVAQAEAELRRRKASGEMPFLGNKTRICRKK